MSSLSGIKAWLPDDLRKQDQIAADLVSVFESANFQRIDIPTLVDMSVVEKANTKFTADVFKLIDRDGRTLALRTELTQPIARLVATRADDINFPANFYYNDKVYRYKGLSTDASREIRQLGVESFGNSDDKSIIELILKSIDKLCLNNSRLTITHSKIWKRIFELYGSSTMNYEQELTAMMKSCAYKSSIADLGNLSVAAKAYKFLLEGDLIRFKKLASEHRLLEIFMESKDIQDYEKVLEIDLSELKLLTSMDHRVVFEPLQCPDLKLYTGLNYNLYSSGVGRLIALGGRYDKLCEEFGKAVPAIGFAFYLPALMEAIEINQQERVLKIAFSKGALLDGAKEYFAAKGYSIDNSNPRKLIVDIHGTKMLGFDRIEALLVRGHDVPTYVQHGAADLGVVGLDVILDSRMHVYQLEDLNYGHCKLCVCAPRALYKSVSDLPSELKVATTFPNLSKDYFDSKGISTEIINLYGSVELGPLTRLSDVIVDLVATGKTLEENGLEVIAEILPCTARLIANKASLKLYPQLTKI
jgi:ATP phosphoribosyltransferase regulatory subunit